MPEGCKLILEYEKLLRSKSEFEDNEIVKLLKVNKECQDMLVTGGTLNHFVCDEVVDCLVVFVNYMYSYMELNPRTTTLEEEEDWAIPDTEITSVMTKALQILSVKRTLTFLIVSALKLELTLPVPAGTAPVADVPAVDTAGDVDEPDEAEQPEVRFKKAWPVYSNEVNKKVMSFGRVFLAEAKNTDRLKDDPERQELIKELKKDGDIKMMEECPFCRKPKFKFSRNADFNRHVYSAPCTDANCLEWAGINFAERASKGQKGTMVTAAGPAVAADDARLPLPMAYGDYPDTDLSPPQLGQILVQLATEESRDMIAAYLHHKQKQTSPMNPLTDSDIDEFLDLFTGKAPESSKDLFKKEFLSYAKAVRTKWSKKTLKITLYYAFNASGN